MLINSLNIIMSQSERSAHETDVLINDLYRIVLRSKNKSILFFKETNGSNSYEMYGFGTVYFLTLYMCVS